MIKAILFDWGNTVMTDFELPGPMFLWEKVAWVPGAEDALKELSTRYSCYLATNAGASETEGVLKALKRVGAEKYFLRIFLAKEIGYEKPDQRFFRFILEQLDVLPGNCVMIGDNYLKDCVGAKKAGLKTIFLNAYKTEGHFPMADRVIMTMEKLTDAIDSL
jgi:HAD superfamily hydrolase (TIGR01509 family)